MRATVRAEPVRARLEVRLKDGFEHQLKASLDHAVGDGRYSELAEFPGITFRDHHPPHLDRPELPRLQGGPELAQERPGPDPGPDHGRGGPVDPGGPGALVGGHAFPRSHQERPVIDEVEQVTETTTRIFGRPAVQFDLHTPYREVRRIRIRPLRSTGIHRCVFGHYIPFLD
ncbi:MAG TPA: hypothetical protein VHZ03_07070 [Trebonia sp.]|nr:hypothetical protein [Trebonia sp.]